MIQSATVAELSPIQTKPESSLNGAKKNVSGIVFQPLDIEKSLHLLDQLDDFDVSEQRETFEYLRQALNEERAAGGERLLFP